MDDDLVRIANEAAATLRAHSMTLEDVRVERDEGDNPVIVAYDDDYAHEVAFVVTSNG